MTTTTVKPNLLLWGLIFLSVGVHLLLLMHIAGLYRPTAPVYIELDLRNISTPIQRNIPRPQALPDPKVSPAVFKPLRIPDEKLFQNEITAIPPLESLLPKNRPEPLRLPKLPEIKGVDIAEWEGESDIPVPHEGSIAETEENIPAEAAYRNQLNEKIPLIYAEADRLYRRKAKKRQIQGRTVVRVVIDHNGEIIEVGITESSEYDMLDEIALKAVASASPFPSPPNRNATLDIPITFKLK